MTAARDSKAIGQMRSVVLIIGLAWLCAVVPLLIGVASVGGAAWTATSVVMTLVGGAVATGGAAATWLLQPWGPVAHVVGAVLVIVKSFMFASAARPFDLPWGYLFVLAIFIAVVAPNRSIFRGSNA